MPLSFVLLIIILVTGVIFSVRLNKLTLQAACVGGAIGLLLFIAAGFFGIMAMTTFFMLGTLATSHKLKTKQTAGLAEINKGKRTTGQVFANAGVAALLSILTIIYPSRLSLFALMIAGAFSAATADTLSSELGNAYGTRFYNILTFKKGTRGLNGVISLEGTLLGVSGSFIIALVYSLFYGFNINVLYIIIAGTVGNITDSLLGASFENKGYLGNNTVNFLNTLVGAITVLLLSLV